MDSSLIQFGRVIGTLRRDAGFSQEALADRAGVHRTYVSQLERGLKSPTLAVLIKLAEALDTRPSNILQLMEHSLNELQDS